MSATAVGIGLMGRKLGMTRVFTDTEAMPVTVLSVADNRVAQIKTGDKDGYDALQLAFERKAAKNLSSPQKGHMAKHKAGAARRLCEFKVDAASVREMKAGGEIGADVFNEGQFIDVVGVSKGKGFAGVIKRHHFSSNRASHGNSRAHRKPGSTGQCQDPGRTFPGKKMPGRLGGKRRTVQNLVVLRVDKERNLLLVRGAVPGACGGYVIVRAAVKKRSGK